jgi:hypothetical protein
VAWVNSTYPVADHAQLLSTFVQNPVISKLLVNYDLKAS